MNHSDKISRRAATLRLAAMAVEDRGNLALAAGTAGSAFAGAGAHVDGELVGGGGLGHCRCSCLRLVRVHSEGGHDADAAARVAAVDAVLLVGARGEASDRADDHAG